MSTKKNTKKPLSPKVLDKSSLATGSKIIKLKDYVGIYNVVLYFYPKDDTPGCTMEGQDFTKKHKQFQSTDTAILGVSRDDVDSHERFKKKYKYNFELLSDITETLCRAFKVLKEKNMYGKKVLGIERSTFVIDKKGRIIKEWRKVKVPGHVDEVLKFVQKL